MGSFSEEEYPFFDACEDIASVSDDATSDISLSSSDDSISKSTHYDLWVRSPRSVKERRSRFLSLVGVDLCRNADGISVDGLSLEGESDRVRDDSGAVLRNSGIEEEFCSARAVMTCCSGDDSGLLEGFMYRDGTAGGRLVRDVDEAGDEENSSEGCVLGSRQSGTVDESVNTSSPSFRRLIQDELDEQNSTPRRFKNWLSRLSSIACTVGRQLDAEKLRNDGDDAPLYRVHRVKVDQRGKQIKELSALYMSQDIQAHEGSILTMKFSPDGRHLASAGMDGIVRLWQVLEDDRSNELDIPEIDPSCIYFTVNHLSELKALFADKENAAKLRGLRKTSESACVIFPPKVFRILENPLHEFHGHTAEILDLSWSTKNHLLSASVDKTVCLWRVGYDNCLRVFSHCNYVTCVQFNPVDDNYFISGSIDGKVRIWAISSCQVVDWTDVKEIVTAVCYRPDAQGGIVGFMEGNCRFFSMSDNHMQLDAQICLNNKKKSHCKSITGFQFSPGDSTKVMVTSADSQVRVLQGHDVVSKYKGLKSAASLVSASFTSDGRHIISASDDSNVYVWNCIDQLETSLQAKSIKSCERFSTKASVAIPWCGLGHENGQDGWGFHVSNDYSPEVLPFCSPASFSLSQEYFLESFPKGSATWPEEKLPSSPFTTLPSMHRSQFKFLKASCQNTTTSHAWGLVIVTAGSDGRIRSFHNYGLPVSV